MQMRSLFSLFRLPPHGSPSCAKERKMFFEDKCNKVEPSHWKGSSGRSAVVETLTSLCLCVLGTKVLQNTSKFNKKLWQSPHVQSFFKTKTFSYV